jgi:hypothetical protein
MEGHSSRNWNTGRHRGYAGKILEWVEPLPWNDIIDLHPKYDRLIPDLIFDKTPEREIRGDQSI